MMDRIWLVLLTRVQSFLGVIHCNIVEQIKQGQMTSE